MLLTLTTTHTPATDLGYLLHKHPDRLQTFPLSFGRAHVYYPEADARRCTCALLLDIDPVQLVRGRPGAASGPLTQYVNDRPYIASSFLSVALARVLGSALNGHCKERPELIEQPLPLSARLTAVPCRGSQDLLEQLFAPLGYQVKAQGRLLDTTLPAWGPSPYFDLHLSATLPLRQLLEHLYVLIPVLDHEKHYWVGDAEVEKLQRHGQGWLEDHPHRELIIRRYLKYQGRQARDLLNDLDDNDAPDTAPRDPSLDDQRRQAVIQALLASGARRILDLGCGDGKLLQQLRPQQQFTELVGMDPSSRALEAAEKRLQLNAIAPGRLQLFLGSLTYHDQRLAGYDGAAVVEVIEHLEPERLPVLAQVLFGTARPKTVVVTTPNREYNIHFPGLEAGAFRHPDHRFEWTREEFRAWAREAAQQHGYTVDFRPIGPDHPETGSPTQMGLFERCP
ncbi:MAG: 3' terminal RNA ribose 2'-O-methyltransferase Hen1 [Candidatus Latescibacteria bacterium]|nr:3' terminal RNA ribose 2'-O-methyltransferase Hen1 [Candidatus Latescibacterota bacterium]